jgi:outer membrane receptor for ferrienterochelin and colicin
MENLNIILGTRLDKYSEHDIVISPRLGLMYLLTEQWKIRATWGKGFRSPTFMERFIDWNHIQFGYQVQGNPNLKPESSEGYTLGLEYYDYSHYQISIMMYYNEFTNLIEDFAIQAGLLSYQNINKAIYRGIEIQNRWEISNTLTSSWGLNIIDNKDGEGNEIPNTQPYSSSAHISYQHPHLKHSLSTNIKWIGPSTAYEYNPNSGTYNSTGEIFEHYIIDGNIKIILGSIMDLIVGIKNIGDYTNNNIGPFIGRSFYLEIKREII